jgi:cytidylate kinase
VISTIPEVRRAMVARQREMGQRGAVLEGRDVGSVSFKCGCEVLPDG